jgi:adenosylhomocysteine nucleosidase
MNGPGLETPAGVRRIGIVAALPGELTPLVRGWNASEVEGTVIHRTIMDETELIAVCCGIGREPAARACMLAQASGPLTALVSIGWAGALSCGMKAGQAYTVNEVVDIATGERYETASEQSGPATVRLLTAKRIVRKDEKRQLAENYAAMLVDMEASTVARLARVHELPFYCVKAVSDGANESLPDMNPFLTRSGQMKISSLVASVVVRPQYWRAMARMGSNSSKAAVALAAEVKQLVGHLQTNGYLQTNGFRHANDHQRI